MCVRKAPAVVKVMAPSDFYNFEKGLSESIVSKKTRPLLANTAKVQFRRGSTMMFYQTWDQIVDGDIVLKEADFLQLKYKKPENLKTGIYAKRKKECRGITETKKSGIIKNLGGLMPASRLKFYKDLKENNKVVDLVSTRE